MYAPGIHNTCNFKVWKKIKTVTMKTATSKGKNKRKISLYKI